MSTHCTVSREQNFRLSLKCRHMKTMCRHMVRICRYFGNDANLSKKSPNGLKWLGCPSNGTFEGFDDRWRLGGYKKNEIERESKDLHHYSKSTSNRERKQDPKISFVDSSKIKAPIVKSSSRAYPWRSSLQRERSFLKKRQHTCNQSCPNF